MDPRSGIEHGWRFSSTLGLEKAFLSIIKWKLYLSDFSVKLKQFRATTTSAHGNPLEIFAKHFLRLKLRNFTDLDPIDF